MIASTHDELMAKSRKLFASGDETGAKRVAQIAIARGNAAKPSAPRKSIGQRFKDNLLGDDDPITQNFGEKGGSFLNKGGESLSFGLVGDEASAAVESLVPGVDCKTRRDFYRDQEKLFEKTDPGALKTGAKLDLRALTSGAATGVGAGVYSAAEGAGAEVL